MDDLYAFEPSEAKKKLLTLRGIGDYSAKLVMPSMGFPLDLWSAKISSVLFFGNVLQDPREAIARLKEEAEKRWGVWRGKPLFTCLMTCRDFLRRWVMI